MLARIGGALIIGGLVLPWYKFDLGQLAEAFGGADVSFKAAGLPTGQTFTAWESARTVFFVIGFFGLLAVSQLPFASPGMVGRFFMIAGFAGFILLGYKIIHPPLDFLAILKMELKPQPGIFIALVGMACTAYAGWEQVKQDLSRPAYQQHAQQSDWQTTQGAGQAAAQQQPQQRPQQQPYAQPQPAAPQSQAAAQAVAAPRVIPPDPFAPKPPTFNK